MPAFHRLATSAALLVLLVGRLDDSGLLGAVLHLLGGLCVLDGLLVAVHGLLPLLEGGNEVELDAVQLAVLLA
ncbi:MAG: hypothetical protein EBR40_11350 [Proteobacteria bacterium]|nr:hypothetical protein [Pseudomonadota bacterium]